MLAILKNKVPLVSSNPFLSPAMEKGWQGNPAHNMSKSGISSSFASLISPLKYLYSPDLFFLNNSGSISLKFSSYVTLAFLSHSLAKTHFAPILLNA